MSEPSTSNQVECLKRANRRWKALALSFLGALCLVFVLGASMTAMATVRAQREAAVARQAEMEARQSAEKRLEQLRLHERDK